jgi:hypothetical protein
MGSYANSLHVRSDDAERVAETLVELFAKSGWRPTQKTIDARAAWAEDSLRGVQISAPRDGWMSILDTDLMGAHTIASRLAKKLATHAIFFFVDDSDSWSYLLADPKGKTSEFESGGDSEDDEDEGGELVEASAGVAQLQALMHDGSMLQKFKDMQEQMLATAPPEVREALERIKSGRAMPEDMQRYQAWAQQELPKHQLQLRSMISGLLNLARIAPVKSSKKAAGRKRTKSQRAAEKKRLDALRPLFAAGVTDEQVQDVLDQRDLFAENVLAEFLPLLGISAYYANLNYRYLSGVRENELAAHQIHFVRDVRFETSRPGQLSHS